MKMFFFFIFLFKTCSLSAQVKNDTFVTVKAGLNIDRRDERKKKLKWFTEKLNNYSGGKLPSFLFNKCFDTQSDLWESIHSPISLRWLVLKKVTNEKALKKILESHDKRLNKRCSYDPGHNPQLIIPLIEKSFRQLITTRYKELVG